MATSQRAGTTPPSAGSSTPSPNRPSIQRSEASWTDDLPVCELSDVGIATNVVYLENGRTMEAHLYEDYPFNFRSENNCYLYGLFDGHDGVKAAHYAAFRLPAELLLGQLNPNYNPPDSSVRKVLYQSFNIVERGFFESLDDALAKKTHLQSQIPDRMPVEMAAKRFPDTFQKIKELDEEIRGGTTAVVALIINNKLFVANVGDSRALLCHQNQTTKQLEVLQLSVDHNIYENQEIARLKNLGLDVEKIQGRGQLGMNECTRCIGDYTVKGGYKEIDFLRDATSEPVIAEPSITEGIIIDEYNSSFLILMSDDLYKSVDQVVRNIDPNEYVAKLTSRELLTCQGIEGVAQNVVNKIAHMHKQTFGNHSMACRGDMTMIVRNFTHPIGIDNRLPRISDVSKYPVSVPYVGIPTCERTDIKLVMPNSGVYTSPRGAGSYPSSTPSDDTPTNLGNTSGFGSSRTDITTGPPRPVNGGHVGLSDEDESNDADFFRCDPNDTLQLDDDNRVRPYISFEGFNEKWQRHINNNSNVKRTLW